MDRDEVIQNLYGIKSYLVAKSCEKSNIPKEALEITKVAFMESIKTINCTITLLKEQEEREKRICKEICGLIKGGYRADTDDDREYICHRIQYIFLES